MKVTNDGVCVGRVPKNVGPIVARRYDFMR
jgi:hypothetical protein